MVPPKRLPPVRPPPVSLPADEESTFLEPPKQLLDPARRGGPIRSAPPPPRSVRTSPPPPVRSAPPPPVRTAPPPPVHSAPPPSVHSAPPPPVHSATPPPVYSATPPPVYSAPPSSMPTVPPMGSQTPAPWALPESSGSSAPLSGRGPGMISPAGQTFPPSTGLSQAPTAIGAKTLIAWIGGAAAVGLLVSVLGAWVFLPDEPSSSVKSPTKQSSSSASASASAIASAVVAKPPESDALTSASSLPSLVARAEQGDPDAIDQIEKRAATDRTVTEALAWARGRSERKRQDLSSIAKALRADLPLSADRETLGKLRPYTDDPETATEALAILASLRTPMSADMLYDVWVRSRGETDATKLAKSLLYTKEVRDSASDALAVVLDLRAATSCEEVAGILPRAEAQADMRALTLLGKLNFRYGCGRRGGQDCYPCLRGKSSINDAIAAARRRPAPGI